MRLILSLILALTIPLLLIFQSFARDWGIATFMSFFLLVVGFVMAGIAAYLAGLLGSSNSPISGVTVITILTVALLLKAWGPSATATGAATAISIGAVIACSSAISGTYNR